jgi:predicted dehydrogenase
MKTPSPTPAEPRRLGRRAFLQTAAPVVLAAGSLDISRSAFAAGSDEIRLALVGCGGRGAGAMANALDVSSSGTRLTAMADVIDHRLDSAHEALRVRYRERVDVPPERRFIGFDAFRKAMDCLRPGDVVALTTHAGFRATHLEYAVARGLNVFMEKSFAPDPRGIRRILELGREAEKKGLKIGTGLMCRHSSARQALIEKIRAGALGDIPLIRAYRMDSGARMAPRPPGGDELLWQIQNPYFLLWVSTGRFIDYLIHQVDECCWIKDAWPVSAHGLGGRAPGSVDASQNLDSYAIEYTFADGTKAQVNGRFIPGCHSDFATFIHGTQCAAQFSGHIHAPTTLVFKDQNTSRRNVAWRPEEETRSPYDVEWQVLLDAIRANRPHNEVERSAKSNLAAIMGRAAVHGGQIVTWDQALASDFAFCPDVAALDPHGPAPVQADASGFYPVPVPGAWKEI